MSEQQTPYFARAELTEEEINQVDYALTVLTPAQLASLAAKVKAVCLNPGFGRVYITIEKGHPALIGTDTTEKLEP